MASSVRMHRGAVEMRRFSLTIPLFVALTAHALAAEPDLSAGARVYHIGNSHTASTMQAALQPMAVAAGHTEHTWDCANIPGAPMDWIWNHDKNYRTDLTEKAWDILTLQTYNKTDDAEIQSGIDFVKLALQGNPNVRVIMYTIWPGAETDWQNPTLGRSEAWTEKVAAAIQAACPGVVVQVAPTSLIIRELYVLADSGRLPHVDNRWGLFSDGGHLGRFGAYAINACMCAMIYREKPFGYHNGEGAKEIPAETAGAIQRVVWDMLATYPKAGMDTGLVVATRRLPAAVQGQSFAVQLEALRAEGDVTWRLAEGALPAGLTLSAGGRISGTPDAVGDFAFMVAAADGAAEASRGYELIVSQDVPPQILTSSLPTVRLEEYLTVELKADGGVGRKSWRLVEAALPHGIQLEQYGVLRGVPCEAGDFPLKIEITDSHPAGERRATVDLVWQIAPAAPEVLGVRKTALQSRDALVLDGRFDEPFWQEAEWVPIDRPVIGSPSATAQFAATWTVDNRGRPRQLYVAVKVDTGGAPGGSADAVEVYWDTLNNKQVIYNVDDNHFRVKRDGGRQVVRGYTGQHHMKCAAAETEEGWNAEFRLSAGAFMGRGVTYRFGAKGVYGFDLAITQGEADSIGRIAWQGDGSNDDDTSAWGVIHLTDDLLWQEPRPARRAE
jgi:hypothetical protein